MPRFFKSMSLPATVGDTITIDGQDAIHLQKSLRLRVGDAVLICDGRSTEYDTVIAAFADGCAQLTVEAVRASVAEPRLKLTLYQGLPKSDKLEYIIQKAVELGITTVVPVATSRSVVKLDAAGGKKKQERWQKIANEAAGQSGRGILPEVCHTISFDTAVKQSANDDKCVFCYELATEGLDTIGSETKTVSVIIGPEGGFTAREAEALAQSGAVTVSLGKRILRAETAPVAALCTVMLKSGNI